MDIPPRCRVLMSRLALIAVVSGCTRTEELKQKIKQLENENQMLRSENSTLRCASGGCDPFSVALGVALSGLAVAVGLNIYSHRAAYLNRKRQREDELARLRERDVERSERVEESVTATDTRYCRVARSRAQARQESFQ